MYSARGGEEDRGWNNGASDIGDTRVKEMEVLIGEKKKEMQIDR